MNDFLRNCLGFKIQSRLLVLHCALSGPMKMNAVHSPNKPDFPPKTGMSYNAGSCWVEILSEGVFSMYMQDIIQNGQITSSKFTIIYSIVAHSGLWWNIRLVWRVHDVYLYGACQ